MAQNFEGLTTAMIHFLSMQTQRLSRLVGGPWLEGRGGMVGGWEDAKKENRRKEGTP